VVAAPFAAYLANLRICLLSLAMDTTYTAHCCQIDTVAWTTEKDSSPAAFRICCCAADRKYQASFNPIHPQYCKLFHTVTHNRLPRLEIISESQQERPPSRCSPINALNDARSDQHTIARAAASVPCIVRPVQTNTRMRVQFDSLHDFNDPERSHQSCCV
jgi:hypothetical protein